MRVAPHLAAFLLVIFALDMAHAAGLNPASTIRGPMVRLSDLFTGLEPGQDCEIGPAPAPGRSIVVAGAQLAAIAAQFGVEWSTLPTARAVITRAGRQLLPVEIEPVLRDALVAYGAPTDGHLVLAPYSAPMVAVDQAGPPTVDQVDYDQKTGRFSASLVVSGGASEPVSLRLVGRLVETVDLPVLVHDEPAGGVLGTGDLRIAGVDTNVVRGLDDIAQTSAAIVGRVLKHAVPAGQPVRLRDTEKPELVRRGGVVEVSLVQGALVLGASLQAMQAGSEGDDIKLVNPSSGAVIVARLNADGTASALPGSAPIGVARAGQIPPRTAGSSFFEARNGVGL